MRPIAVPYRCALAFLLNRAVDKGRHTGVTVNRVQRLVGEGTVFKFIEELAEGAPLLSVLRDEDRALLLSEWRHFGADYNERKSFGVESNGVCLLIAYVLEGIQLQESDNSEANQQGSEV